MSKPDVKRFRKLLDEKAAELALSIRPHELEGAADQARAGPAEAMQVAIAEAYGRA